MTSRNASAEADNNAGAPVSELVATRLCHDLAGLVSAFANGAEILAEHADDDSMRASSVELLKISAEDASARLRVFRKLFGVGAESESDFYATVALVRHYLRGFEVIEPEGDAAFSHFPPYADKAALAFALIVHKAFPRKARVTFRAEGKIFVMRAEGRAFMLDAEERATLDAATQPDFPLPRATYKNLAASTLASLCRKAGARIEPRYEENALAITVTLS
ncbi:MAG: hypothetical protein ABW189_02210 [Rickettsiales bacterium]